MTPMSLSIRFFHHTDITKSHNSNVLRLHIINSLPKVSYGGIFKYQLCDLWLMFMVMVRVCFIVRIGVKIGVTFFGVRIFVGIRVQVIFRLQLKFKGKCKWYG